MDTSVLNVQVLDRMIRDYQPSFCRTGAKLLTNGINKETLWHSYAL